MQRLGERQERVRGGRTPTERNTSFAVKKAACKTDKSVKFDVPPQAFMTKDELKSKGFYSINRLSELISADRRSIKRHLVDEQPDHVHKGINYYELNRVADIIEDASSKGTDKQNLECKKLVAQINNIELRNAELSRKLIPSEEVARVWLANVGKARGILLGMEELAPALCGLDATEIKVKIKDAVQSILEALNACPVDEHEAD